MAELHQPCIMLWDEADKLLEQRGASGSAGASASRECAINQLLTVLTNKTALGTMHFFATNKTDVQSFDEATRDRLPHQFLFDKADSLALTERRLSALHSQSSVPTPTPAPPSLSPLQWINPEYPAMLAALGSASPRLLTTMFAEASGELRSIGAVPPPILDFKDEENCVLWQVVKKHVRTISAHALFSDSAHPLGATSGSVCVCICVCI